tara:strand:+ start:1404 stop:1529 length:126 start_codon:yes stop_codon:yes gene_type:complete
MVIVVPNDLANRVDSFLETHEGFMKETHHIGFSNRPLFFVM